MTADRRWGLWTEGNVCSPVPLQSIAVHTEVIDFCSEVTVAQTYKNTESNVISTRFIFPVEDTAAVTSFTAQTQTNGTIKGEVKEKAVAKAQYDEAVQSGVKAAILEQRTDDLLSVEIGNVLPGEEVTLEIVYVKELDAEDDNLRFMFPLTTVRRYTPSGSTPVDVSLTTKPTYTFAFSGTFRTSAPITAITSPSHENIAREIKDAGFLGTVSLSNPDLDEDLVICLALAFEDGSLGRLPLCAVEEHPDHHTPAALLAFFPDLPAVTTSSEIIILIDRSGSMGGNRISMAATALQMLLRSLPFGCYFNIIGFGTSEKWLFTDSVKYDDNSLEKATRHVSDITANLGGTEILKPMQKIYRQKAQAANRSIFILTDGAVSNTQSVIDLVKRKADQTRVFTLGIGSGCSTALVNGCATAGRGMAEYVVEGEAMNKKVVRQLKRALQPAVHSVSVQWGSLPFIQAPSHLPSIFRGERLVIYGLPKPGAKMGDVDGTVTISAVDGAGEKHSFAVDVGTRNVIRGDLVHRLAAKTRIQKDSLEYKDSVALSTHYGIASKLCSFVAIAETSSTSACGGVLRVVPTPAAGGGRMAMKCRKKKKSGSVRSRGPSASRSRGVSAPRSGVAPRSRGRGGGMSFSCRAPSAGPSAPMSPSACPPPAPMACSSRDRMSECSSMAKETLMAVDHSSMIGMQQQQQVADSLDSLQAAPASQSMGGSRRLEDIVMAQASSGTWSLAFAARLVGKTATEVQEACQLAPTDENATMALAIALVTAFLKRKFRQRKDEWELVVEKGKRWCSAHSAAKYDTSAVNRLAREP